MRDSLRTSTYIFGRKMEIESGRVGPYIMIVTSKTLIKIYACRANF